MRLLPIFLLASLSLCCTPAIAQNVDTVDAYGAAGTFCSFLNWKTKAAHILQAETVKAFLQCVDSYLTNTHSTESNCYQRISEYTCMAAFPEYTPGLSDTADQTSACRDSCNKIRSPSSGCGSAVNICMSSVSAAHPQDAAVIKKLFQCACFSDCQCHPKPSMLYARYRTPGCLNICR